VAELEAEDARLKVAEASMRKQLDRVNKETAAVEQAVEDLRQARAELDKDFIVKLKKGGLVKQGALAGFLLFAVRSLLDSVQSLADPSYLAPALVQGAIAISFILVFFFL
jgi:hypothetical protein